MTDQNEIVEEVVDSTAESTDYATPETEDGYEYVEVSNADEYWDKFDLNAYIADSSDKESNETDDAEVDDGSSDDTAFPSEDEVADAEDATEEVEADEEINEEELLNLDLDRPAPLSRRKAEKVVKGIIEPLRDPNTPISDVLSALAEFHPTRTQQLAEAIVNESVQAYPDEWLRSITGIDVTLDQIREWAAMGGRQPSNPAPAVGDSSEFEAAQAELNEYYGENWKNPAFDGDILATDLPLVRALRAQLDQNSAYAALQQELEQTKSQLNQLQPQIDSIKTAQEAEFEQLVMTTLTNEVNDYRTKIENSSIPKVLEAKGLVPRETDSDEVKAAKELLASRFKGLEGYGSDFDVFLDRQFSGKEPMAKAIQRVGDYLTQAATLEAKARRTGNQSESQVLTTKAAALKEQALLEQDALTVWTRKAAVEFLDTPHVKPILTLLQQNADLRRRLQASGRPEIVGQTAATGEGGFKSAVQSAKEQGVNPFDLDISSILGGR